MVLGPVLAVIGLEEISPYAAAFGGAGREQPVEGGLLVGVGPPAQVRHADDILAFGNYALQEGVASVHHVVDGLGRDGAEPGYLARLSVNGVAAHHRRVVHPDHDLGWGDRGAAG